MATTSFCHFHMGNLWSSDRIEELENTVASLQNTVKAEQEARRAEQEAAACRAEQAAARLKATEKERDEFKEKLNRVPCL